MGKLQNLGIALFGNRVTLAGAAMSLSGLSSLAASKGSDENFLVYGLGWVALSAGNFLLGVTIAGAQTARHYNKAMSHVDENGGEFDERYFQGTLQRNSLMGNYCIEQGVYLAARKSGRISQFREAQKRYSRNIIPVF